MKDDNFFYRVGIYNTKYTWINLVILGLILTYSTFGVLKMEITNDPDDLWVNKDSKLYHQQEFVNNNFGKFYRPEQMFFRIKNDDSNSKDIIRKYYLEELYYFQELIMRTNVTYQGKKYSFQDLCWSALPEANCTIQSPLGYWQNNLTRLRNDVDLNNTLSCLKSIDPTNVLACFDDSGIPVQKGVVWGGVEEIKKNESGNGCGNDDDCTHYNYTAKRMSEEFYVNSFFKVVSMLLKNVEDLNPINEVWEKEAVMRVAGLWGDNQDTEFLKKLLPDIDIEKKPLNLSVNYMVGRSIQDELEVESSQNAFIVILSYGLMLLYISIGLGKFPSKVGNTFGMGFIGVLLVGISVVSGYATVSFLGIKASLICLEVLPFLILAIGVDNMFIIAQAVDRQESNIAIEKKVGLALKEVGPSITVAFLTEVVTFAVGIMTKIPALKVFCITAVAGISFNYILQMTIFISIYTKDLKRRKEKRCDILFWIKDESAQELKPNTLFKDLFKKYYTPFLGSKIFMIITLGIAGIMVSLGPFAFGKLKLGIEQQLSTRTNGNLYNYFNDLEDYLGTGPPLYIIMKDYDPSNTVTINLTNSMVNILDLKKDLIRPPVQNWVVDFRKYLDSLDMKCQPDFNKNAAGQMEDFMKIQTKDYCCQNVGICGSQYKIHVNYNVTTGKIGPARLAMLHSPLDNQEAYIRNYVNTTQIVDWFSFEFWDFLKAKGPDVTNYPPDSHPTMFANSVFYIYFEQYTYIKGVAVQNFAIAIVILFTIVTFAFSVTIGAYMVLLLTFVITSMTTLLWLTNVIFSNEAKRNYPVRMNAVTVVNLVTAIGFAVEFCIHTLLKYEHSQGKKHERIKKAITEMGSSVFSGIFITKLLGVFILAFAPSAIFRLYYFRMYIIMILTCGYFGLVVLPGLLFIFGGDNIERAKVVDQEDQEDEDMGMGGIKMKND